MLKKLICILLTIICAEKALADEASIKILGLTKDEKIFVFEESGSQDGSGYPYLNLHYVSVETNEYLTGAPFKYVFRSVNHQVDNKLNAKIEAEKLTKVSDRNLVSGSLIAYNPITEISTNDNLIEFALSANDILNKKTWIIKLEQFSIGRLKDCQGFVDYIPGFEIMLLDPTGLRQATQIYSDKQQPKERGCVDSYRLGGIYAYPKKNGEWIIAILVSVKSVGFEGNDYRWIANVTILPPLNR